MSDTRLITCDQLDERLAEWMEQEVDARTDAALARHVAGCARCAALVDDLRSIRRAAASLPALTPSRDLWPEIEARIQAPVITLPSRAAHRAPRSTWWMGAAAAGLVAVTAGVTYLVTTNGSGPGDTTVAVAPTTRGPDLAPPTIVTEPSLPVATEPEPANAEPRTAPRGEALSVARNTSPAADNSEYARDVAQLRAIVTQRRTEFDSTTIAVLEKNLELIDRAIAESRAALERDPASEFLADQLARAMTKKVAILRTVALLPARS
jgi:hypothetical protein